LYKLRLLVFCFGIWILANSLKQQGYWKFLICFCWSWYYWHVEAKLDWPMPLNTRVLSITSSLNSFFFFLLSLKHLHKYLSVLCWIHCFHTGCIYLWRAGSACSKCDIVWMWLYKCLVWGYDVWPVSIYWLLFLSTHV